MAVGCARSFETEGTKATKSRAVFVAFVPSVQKGRTGTPARLQNEATSGRAGVPVLLTGEFPQRVDSMFKKLPLLFVVDPLAACRQKSQLIFVESLIGI